MLLTELRPGGGQMVWRPGEPLPAPVLQEEIDRLWIQGGARRLRSPGGMWFAEVWAPNPSLLMVGASPIATALCDLATRVGFRVWVVDPRRDFARRELFPAAVEVIHQWPEEGLKTAGLDRESYVAVLAHDAKLDVPAVASALRADCRYVGLLGSPSTQEDRRRALMKMGVSEEAMRRIHGPIGLKSLGGIEPGEIAVSILAEMIQVRRGKREKR
jgi:xanthine dehydrogenase accessory factor